MRITMIIFSPSGNTLKVAEMLESSFQTRNFNVQLIDISREAQLFETQNFREYLWQVIHGHDLLMIGGPVYAGHLQYNLVNLMKHLPKPDNHAWGNLAVPFVTYGGMSSGNALYEMGKLFKKSGRTTILGMKINSQHCGSKRFAHPINQDMPGEEAKPLIGELVERVLAIKRNSFPKRFDLTSELNYQNFSTKLKDRFLFKEKFFQKVIYPKVFGQGKIEQQKCGKCGLCVLHCPVQRFKMTKQGPIVKKKAPACIHCGECYNNCPKDAVNFNLKHIEATLRAGIQGKGLLASHETPKSAVYPIVGLNASKL